MMLTRPADAFLPNSVPCGPRSTSSRSISTRSPNASPDRANTTPSTTVDTDGSPAIEKVVVPTPRRNSDWLSVVPDFWKLSAGTSDTAPSSPGRASVASAAPPITDTAIGTSCNRSLRFCAVMTISPGCASSAGACVAVPGAGGGAGGPAGSGAGAGLDAGAMSCANAAVPAVIAVAALPSNSAIRIEWACIVILSSTFFPGLPAFLGRARHPGPLRPRRHAPPGRSACRLLGLPFMPIRGHKTTVSYMKSPLRTVALGDTGLTVSTIAWGMWRFAGEDVAAARVRVEAALDAGITLLDTADIYGPDNAEAFGAAEALLGRVLADAPGLRDRMVLASKGGIRMGVPYDSSPAYLADAIDASLARLGCDRIDLYQIHRPDLLTHPQEVARTLDDARTAGKIAAIGVSNHTPAQAAALAAFLPVPLVSHQPEFSALATAPLFDGLFDQAMERGMAVLAWSPLGGGRLADPQDDRARAVVALLDAKAAEAGVDRAAVAYSWIMAHPAAPIPIVGTQNPSRIATVPDAYTPRWTRTEWYAVLQASLGESLP